LALAGCTTAGPGLDTTTTSQPGATSTTAATTTTTPWTSPENPNLAAGSTASASQSLPEEPPGAAVDGDPTTQWGSGGDPTQWIEIDLGEPVEIGRIVLTVAQFPDGLTRHLVDIDGMRVWAFENDTADNEVLDLVLDTPITGQVIRVTTIFGPSWVAWKEIEVLAPTP
jgi:hypothetical protein